MKIVKCEELHGRTVIAVTGADANWIKALSNAAKDCSIIPGNSSVTVGAGIVYGEYDTIRAVQAMLLRTGPPAMVNRFDYGNALPVPPLTGVVRDRIARQVLTLYASHLANRTRGGSPVSAFDVHRYIDEVYGEDEIADPKDTIEKLRDQLDDAATVGDAVSMAQSFIAQCQAVTS